MVFLLTFIGSLFGVLYFIFQDPTYIFRIEYEYNNADKAAVPSFLKSDSALLHKSTIFVRNYKTSISDTLQNIGLTRGEVKIQMRHKTTHDEKIELFNDLTGTSLVHFLQLKAEVKKLPFQFIYYGSVAGFFLALILRYFSSNSNPKPKKTDIIIPN